MIFIGIDPGVSGGIAAVFETGTVRCAWKMPATEHDLLSQINMLKARAHDPGLAQVFAVLERAQTMPGMGVVGAFTYGRGYGALRMALTAAAIPFDEVAPAKWQQVMGCRSGGDKNVTKRRAQQLFPTLTITHAIADALLIAEFCRRTHQRINDGKKVKGGEAQDQAGRRSGTTALRGRPLDENGAIEFTRIHPHPKRTTRRGDVPGAAGPQGRHPDAARENLRRRNV